MTLDTVQTWVVAHAETIGRVALILFGSLLLGRLLGSLLGRSLAATPAAPSAPLARRVVHWSLFGLGLATAARELGFDLSVLLGAAGVLSVAVGFASQTSASNVISGVFLLAERPFVPGDVIRVGAITGEVLAVDLLAIKLRTFDNLYVRIPNETVMKSDITNLTRFPIRRLDIPVRVPWGTDAERIHDLLHREAEADPLVLDEPRPSLLFQGWGEAGMELQFSVWSSNAAFYEVRTRLALQIHRRLNQEGLLVGVPQRLLVPPAPEPR